MIEINRSAMLWLWRRSSLPFLLTPLIAGFSSLCLLNAWFLNAWLFNAGPLPPWLNQDLILGICAVCTGAVVGSSDTSRLRLAARLPISWQTHHRAGSHWLVLLSLPTLLVVAISKLGLISGTATFDPTSAFRTVCLFATFAIAARTVSRGLAAEQYLHVIPWAFLFFLPEAPVILRGSLGTVMIYGSAFITALFLSAASSYLHCERAGKLLKSQDDFLLLPLATIALPFPHIVNITEPILVLNPEWAAVFLAFTVQGILIFQSLRILRKSPHAPLPPLPAPVSALFRSIALIVFLVMLFWILSVPWNLAGKAMDWFQHSGSTAPEPTSDPIDWSAIVLIFWTGLLVLTCIWFELNRIDHTKSWLEARNLRLRLPHRRRTVAWGLFSASKRPLRQSLSTIASGCSISCGTLYFTVKPTLNSGYIFSAFLVAMALVIYCMATHCLAAFGIRRFGQITIAISFVCLLFWVSVILSEIIVFPIPLIVLTGVAAGLCFSLIVFSVSPRGKTRIDL